MRSPYGRDTLHSVDRVERGRAHPDRAGPAEMAQVVDGSHAMSMAEGDLRAQLARVTQSYEHLLGTCCPRLKVSVKSGPPHMLI